MITIYLSLVKKEETMQSQYDYFVQELINIRNEKMVKGMEQQLFGALAK